MSLTTALSAGRTAAEARMLSLCTIRRKTAEETEDADGLPVSVWETTYTALPLRLAGVVNNSATSRRIETAGVEFELATRTAHLPASTSNLRDGDLIDITSGESAGLVLRIVEASWQDQSTARRVPVVETGRPEEWP